MYYKVLLDFFFLSIEYKFRKEKLWCNKVLEMGNINKFVVVFVFSNLFDGVILNI